MNNTPEPPSGPAPQEPMGGPMMDDGGDMPDMGPEPGPEMPEAEEEGKADSEIDSIFSKLDTEKQAAVIKYAKSMVGDDAEAEGQPQDMMESVVNEITNNILQDDEPKTEDREDKKIRNRKITSANPFKTKAFNKK